MTQNILAVDIGGTNSRFAHFTSAAAGTIAHVKSVWLSTKAAKSFEELLLQIKNTDFSLPIAEADLAVFALAGPIEDGVFCSPPLIEWDIDARYLTRDFGVKRFFLINDFLAQAYATETVLGQNAEPILPGTAEKDMAVAVVGAGTGLGKAVLLRGAEGEIFASPSEGGHVNFSAESEEEFRFQESTYKRLAELGKADGPYVSWNDIVSGSGLSYIHEFLTGHRLTPQEVGAQLSPDSKTLSWASRFYGRVCRNYTLETLALGGVFIAGGIAAKNPLLVKHEAFKQAFRNARAHAALLAKVPVYLMANQESGLWGAAFYGSLQLRKVLL